VKSFKDEILFVLITTSFNRQFQDWSCPAKYTYYSSVQGDLQGWLLRIESKYGKALNKKRQGRF
jgi:hypothetical protein